MTIKNTAHILKSSVAAFSIDIPGDILHEMKVKAAMAIDIEKIKQLNDSLHVLCKQVFKEIEKKKIK